MTTTDIRNAHDAFKLDASLVARVHGAGLTHEDADEIIGRWRAMPARNTITMAVMGVTVGDITKAVEDPREFRVLLNAAAKAARELKTEEMWAKAYRTCVAVADAARKGELPEGLRPGAAT